MQIALEQLEALLKTLDDKKVAEFEYEDERIRLRIALGRVQVAQSAPLAAAPAVPAIVAEAADPSIVYITSPFVGTFYRAASPEAANFVEEGSSVKSGQTLCIIEAMKLMNEIEAEFACTVVEVLADNGKSVEFGQKLFKVRKT
ncbi:MAG TPA: acetyl-CoA carboxylase biotin carboxyl carrier protein [Polyangiaceae bacterium]|nr:acetyl-CoA carboxylase biotin carboxyl carrier protein [Polyangiaceae bacterium]